MRTTSSLLSLVSLYNIPTTSAAHFSAHVSPALVFYEYVITFEQELAVVWRRKFTLVSLLLIVVRWTLLVEAIILALPQPSEDVRILHVVSQASLTSQFRGL